MHKREFLKRLVGMGGATAFASSLPAHDWTSPEFPSADRPIIHRNWSIYWTGWKATAHTDRLHGQWLARKVDDDTSPRLYVGVPGMIGGQYWPGSQFYLGMTSDSVDTETTKAHKDDMIRVGFAHIRQFIDAVQWYGKIPSGGYHFADKGHQALLADLTRPEPEYTFGFTGFQPPKG